MMTMMMMMMKKKKKRKKKNEGDREEEKKRRRKYRSEFGLGNNLIREEAGEMEGRQYHRTQHEG